MKRNSPPLFSYVFREFTGLFFRISEKTTLGVTPTRQERWLHFVLKSPHGAQGTGSVKVRYSVFPGENGPVLRTSEEPKNE
jgi:hypothetical protein